VADHDNPERFHDLTELIMGAYLFIRDYLREQLPLPVALPASFTEEGIPPHQVLIAVDRARHLIEDEPIPDELKTMLGRLLLDWFTAYDLAALVQLAGPALWRLDAIDYALRRAAIMIELIEEAESDEDDATS
jgi:hypothetical protein